MVDAYQVPLAERPVWLLVDARFLRRPAYVSAAMLFDWALYATSGTLCTRRLFDGVFPKLRDDA